MECPKVSISLKFDLFRTSFVRLFVTEVVGPPGADGTAGYPGPTGQPGPQGKPIFIHLKLIFAAF